MPTEPVAAPEGLRPPETGPRQREMATRKPLALWDRTKFLLLLAIIWFVLVWSSMADNPLLPFVDAVREQVRSAAWVLVLFGLEVLRQLHFLLSEHAAWYNHFWQDRVFGGADRFGKRRLSDWTRFRLGRVAKWLFWIAVLAVVLGQIYDLNPVLALFEAPRAFVSALPFIFQFLFFGALVIFQFVAIFWFLSKGGIDTYFPDDIKTRFSDVWGQDHVVNRVKENIVFLENPEAIEKRGGYVPGGILLWGPPGTGKTLMAEAVAGETGKPYVFVDPGAFTNMFMGVGILKVKSLFRKLRKLALRYGGVIVFFDEADALGSRGALGTGQPGGGRGATPAPFSTGGCHGFSYLDGHTQSLLTQMSASPGIEAEPETRRNRFIMGAGMGGGAGMGTLQALLTEMSGLKKPRGFVNRIVRRTLGMRPKPPPKYRILIMMATNLPEALDEALLRPGRIDRMYKVGYPSKVGRIRTYQGYFDKVRNELTYDDLDKLSTVTPYATGATMKDLVNESLITAIRDGREVITWRDVMKAKQLKELGPAEDVEYIERERHAVAVHEACHAVVAYRVRAHLEIDLATIEKGSDYLGMVASIPPEDQFTRWRTEYEADILVSLASLAGERLFFETDNSSGVSGDLDSATAVAALMESRWGMGSGVTALQALQRLGIAGGNPEPRKREPGIGFAGTPRGVEDAAGGILGQRIEFNLTRLLDKAEQILKDSRLAVLAVAHSLETHKTLTGEDVVAVIEGQRGPFVDGRPYHLPAFLPMMETYHEAALHAHQRHAKPEVRLPDVDELQFAPTWSSNGDGEAHLALPAGEAPATEPMPEPPEPGENGQGRPALESSEES